jgi:hypothetical protein
MRRTIGIGFLLAALAAAGFAQGPPTDPGARITQLVRENRLAEAEALASEWAEREPGSMSMYHLGMVLFQKRDLIQAHTVLQRALASGPMGGQEMAKSLTMLGLIDWEFKNYQAAAKWFAQARRLPDLPADLRRQIDTYADQAARDKEFTTWRQRDTPLIEFHYPNEPGIEPAIDRLKAEYTALFQALSREFGFSDLPRVQFYYYPTETLFRHAHPDAPHTFVDLRAQSIHGWPESRLRHEFMHLMVWRINKRNYPSFQITEGFTEYLNRRHEPARLHLPAAVLAQTRGLPEADRFERIDFYQQNIWAFDLVCSFTAYLVDRIGWDKYLAFWKAGRNMDADVAAHFGATLAELQSAWAAWLKNQPVPETELWRAFEEEILDPGLFADGARMLEGPGDLSPLGRMMRARALAGSDRTADALAAIRGDAGDPDTLRAALPAPAWPAGLLVAGQLWDVAGDRDRAVAFYRAADGLADRPARIQEAADLYLKTPCRAVDFRLQPEPDSVKRADHLVRFRIRTGLSGGDLAAAVCAGLDADKLRRLFRNLEEPHTARAGVLREYYPSDRRLELPERFVKAVDATASFLKDDAALRAAVQTDLAGGLAEVVLRKTQAAGISILDVWECVERRAPAPAFPPPAPGTR